MLTTILNKYEIQPKTVTLAPVKHTDYSTMVMETDKIFFVKKTPLQIIKAACLQGYSTYDGRRNAVMYLTGFKRKVPIPINPQLHIFAFPTQSPEHFECIWIFPHHIKSIQPLSTKNKAVQSKILFHGGQELLLNESTFVLEKQMQRTAYCSMKVYGNRGELVYM